MKKFYAPLIAILLFFAGFAIGSHFQKVNEQTDVGSILSTRMASESVSVLPITQSSRLTPVPGIAPPSAERLADPVVRAALEKYLRDTPYSVLRQVFLERQDEQWLRQQARYSPAKEVTEEERERLADDLLAQLQKNSGTFSNYVSRGELHLRGGKVVSYVAVVDYYGTQSPESTLGAAGIPVVMSVTDLAAARHGASLCYLSTLYLRIDGKLVSSNSSGCLPFVSMRGGRPFATHADYTAKRSAPYFDAINLALPGFRSDDLTSEWYDAGTGRWNTLGRLRFDSISRDEYSSLTKELRAETAED